MLIAILFVAAAAQQVAAPPLGILPTVEVLHKPTRDELNATFPSAAKAMDRQGVVILTCRVREGGALTCDTPLERPIAYGRAGAAYKAASLYRVRRVAPNGSPTGIPATME